MGVKLTLFNNTIDILVPIWYYIYVRRERYG
nr:MAG TPA: hypothetical protein [Caudoviricetes sp.]